MPADNGQDVSAGMSLERIAGHIRQTLFALDGRSRVRIHNAPLNV